MRRRKPLITALVTGLLAATAGVTAAVSSDATHPASAGGTAHPSPESVTLITGDRVAFTDQGGVAIERGEGRDHVSFHGSHGNGHHFVIPSDAVPLLAAGRLDRRLFDVSLLRESGYHDGRASLPLIVTYEGSSARSMMADAGADVTRALSAVNGAAVEVPRDRTAEFWDSLAAGRSTLAAGVSTVWLDGIRQPLLDESVPQVGAAAAHAAGLDGTGVTVAVLDTGIDATHPDLAGRVVGQRNFIEGAEDDRDLAGHGTHVASTVAGTGAASGGQFRGMAPGARLLDGKVCIEEGCAESWILAGMQWAAEQGASVVNMSLGGADFPGLDPLEEAVETLTAEHGTLFVIAAGNDGQVGGVSSPGSADSALAVGAVDKSDQLADFSNRGPRIDGALKPDLTAPGVEITAARSKDSARGVPGQPYLTLSGTSMATPHVTGAAAILAQQHPDWSPGRLKAALMGSAAPHPELDPYAQGAGRLDVARAITQLVTTGPASVSFDRAQWPHDDDPPQTRTISYQNHGTAGVTLALELATIGPDGGPAPAGLFTLGATSVTVPAGGTAQVEITLDSASGDASGFFGGRVLATGPGGVAVTTPFAVDLEGAVYQVTLSHLDRAGEPTSEYLTTLWPIDEFGDPIGAAFENPEVTVRVPAGNYLLGSNLFGESAGEPEETLLVQPTLTVDRDMTITLDARAGEPVSPGVPDPSAVPTYTIADVQFTGDTFNVGVSASTRGQGRLLAAQVGLPQPAPGVLTTISGGHAVPADGDIAASETVFHQAYIIEERFITGFERTPGWHELARVRADHAVQVDGSVVSKAPIPVPVVPRLVVAQGPSLPLDAPLVRTEYYNTGELLAWSNSVYEEVVFGEEDSVSIIALSNGSLAYRAGRTYAERWNYGVFGPSLPHRLSGATRTGDRLAVTIGDAMYSDGGGHQGESPASGVTRVFRDGELIAEAAGIGAAVEVPPERARYRVEVEAERSGAPPLSRRTSLAWEFASGHVNGATEVQLPTWVVRFSPDLRPDNTAPAGRPFQIPVTVEPAPAAEPGRPRSLTVEVSFDDGTSWRRVPVHDGKLRLTHPRQAGYVSLRATTTDSEGNAVEQTVIRAYEIR